MNLNLKIIAIFFILIFCLTPLASADLDQDDTNASASTDEIIEIDDEISAENSTADIIADESKSPDTTENNTDNELTSITSDDVKSTDIKDNITEVEINETRENQTKESGGSLKVQISDFYEGDHPTIKVSTPKMYDSLNLFGSVDCHIYNENYSSPTYKEFLSKDSPANFKIHDTLEPGTYKVYVSGFNGSNDIYGYTTFTVKENPNRISPNLTLNISSVYEGEDVIAKVKARGNFTAYVPLYINGTYFDAIWVEEGYGEVNLHNGWGVGKFIASVDYPGDVNFLPDEAYDDFRIYSKMDTQLKVHVDDVSPIESAKLKIKTNCPEKIKVNYRVLDPRNWIFKEGVVEVNSSEVIELPKTSYAGKYRVTVKFDGNSDYRPCEATATYNVEDRHVNPDLRINVNDIGYGEEENIEINAEKGFSESIHVKLNTSDKIYNVDLVDGHGNLKIKDLTRGNYSATASFAGNDDFNPTRTTAKFTVKGIESKINVYANDIYANQPQTINVSTDTSSPRTVLIQLYENSTLITKYSVKVMGHESINLHEKFDESGEYTVKAIYEGDDKYEYCENTTSFKVMDNPDYKPVDLDLKVNVNDIGYGEEENIEINAEKGFSESIHVKLNTSDKIYNVDLVDGHGNLKIKDLTRGNYSATASFAGNDDFNPTRTTAKFTVKGIESKINVYANDIYANQPQTINVSTDTSSPRTVLIQLYENSTLITKYSVKVMGHESINLHEKFDESGEYTVKAIYEGDDKYEYCENTTSFKVKDNPDN